MSTVRRIGFVVYLLIGVLILIVALTRVAGPAFQAAESSQFALTNGPFAPAYEFIRTVTYTLIVPAYLLPAIAYLVFGGAQEEVQKERRRRRL